MHTLHEFLTQTKGMEYLIAVAVLVLFIAFWRLATKPSARAQTAMANVFKALPFGISDIKVPNGVFFGKGHLWARPELNGTMRIGVDDLIPKLVGPVKAISVPLPNAVLQRGEKAFSVKSDGRSLDFRIPFEGKVVEVNSKILNNPTAIYSDPYRAGWILKVKPAKLTEALKFMKVAEDAADWMKKEATRVRDFIANAYPGRPEPAGAILLDGGQILGGALHKLNEIGWKNFQKEFLEEI